MHVYGQNIDCTCLLELPQLTDNIFPCCFSKHWLCACKNFEAVRTSTIIYVLLAKIDKIKYSPVNPPAPIKWGFPESSYTYVLTWWQRVPPVLVWNFHFGHKKETANKNITFGASLSRFEDKGLLCYRVKENWLSSSYNRYEKIIPSTFLIFVPSIFIFLFIFFSFFLDVVGVFCLFVLFFFNNKN